MSFEIAHNVTIVVQAGHFTSAGRIASALEALYRAAKKENVSEDDFCDFAAKVNSKPSLIRKGITAAKFF